MKILTFLSCFSILVSNTALGQLAIIAQAVLTMTGPVTMRGVSRWTDKGGSYRTIQRFFATQLPWSEMLVKFFETYFFDPTDVYLLAGDATTITKAGKKTYGIDRFFSGVLGQAVRGLEFFVFSVVSVKRRKSYPLAVGQTVRSEAEKAVLKQRREERKKKIGKKRKSARRGRPKGVKNKVRGEVEYSPELLRINGLMKQLVSLVRLFVPLKYVVLDGHFGHFGAVLMVQENELELISKLRCDASLHEKYEGEYSGKGRRRKYGQKPGL